MNNVDCESINDTYESLWRSPNDEEIEYVSGLVQIDADYHKPLIKIAAAVIIILSVISAILIIVSRGNYSDALTGLLLFAVCIVFCTVYLCVMTPRVRFKPKWANEGRFVVADTRVVSKEIYEGRTKSGNKICSYYLKVKLVDSSQGGDNDYRTYRVDSFDYRCASVGSPGIIVRYDTNLDGRPFMWMEHYLKKRKDLNTQL